MASFEATPVKSLVRLSLEACLANIRNIRDLGEAPYHLVRPLLLKVENPQHLRELEEASPQICGVNAELWRAFIKRDIRGWESKNIEPKNPKSWYKVYRRLKNDMEEESRQKEEALRAVLNQKTAERASNQMQYIDSVIDPKKPKPVRQQTTFARIGNPSIMTFASGSRTRTTTGTGMLNKARREARERSLFSAHSAVLSTPTHRLTEKATHGHIVGPNYKGNSAPHMPPPQRIAPSSTTGVVSATGPDKRAQPAMGATTDQGSLAPPKLAAPRKRPPPSIFLPNKRPRI